MKKKKDNKNKKSRTAQIKTDRFGNKIKLFLSLTLLVTISLLSFLLWNSSKLQSLQINDISLEDKGKLGKLILMVASNPGDANSVANSFRKILAKYGIESDEQLKLLKEYLDDLFYLPKLFYQDAQTAIKNKKPFKSSERNRLEKLYLKDGFLTQEQVQGDVETMELIANKKPIAAAHGVEIFIDEVRISEMLREWNDKEMEKIINIIFSLNS